MMLFGVLDVDGFSFLCDLVVFFYKRRCQLFIFQCTRATTIYQSLEKIHHDLHYPAF